ncbi:MAG TPA: hypothetical protein VF240_08100 [Pyrinomonadaceae bacterium]
MSVIGRLDDQVDAVLIKPLSKKGERVDAHEDAPAQTSTPRPADAAPAADDATDRERPPRELPVWLL